MIFDILMHVILSLLLVCFIYTRESFTSFQGSVLQSAYQSDMAWAAQINIWLMITEFYLKLDEPNQAASSVNEAAQISSTHPDVLFYVINYIIVNFNPLTQIL